LHAAYEAWGKGDHGSARAAMAVMIGEIQKHGLLHPIDATVGGIENGLAAMGFVKKSHNCAR
jgi:hypothetical protein